MSKERLNLIGWIAIFNAVIMLPIIILSLLPGIESGPKIILIILFNINFFAFIIVFSSLKKLLSTKFSFSLVNNLITSLILITIISTIINEFQFILPEYKVQGGTINALFSLIYGVIFIVFSIKIRRLKENLYGLLKPISYSIMIAGFCYGSIILIPIGFLASSVYNIILGMLFMRASEHYEEIVT
ncbi:hypothetical protein FJZ17_04560 [Candidatus Pacearchaeota archaeon]|nr:hypothetical protein [Candidatus Pacearchaeota archaeon]